MLRKDSPKFSAKLKEHKRLCRERKVSFNTAYSEVASLHNDMYLHECRTCSHVWNSSVSAFVRRTGCPACAHARFRSAGTDAIRGTESSRRLTKTEAKKRLREVGYTLLSDYMGYATQITVRCRNGHVSTVWPSNGFRHTCNECSGRRLKTTDEHNAELTAKNPKLVCVKYVAAKSRAEYRCRKCSFTWSTYPTNILRDDRCYCPSCDARKWKSCFKIAKLGRRHVRVRGYEHHAITYMTKTLGVKPTDVLVDLEDDVPSVKVGRRKHRPDFYVKSQNRLVEVKSVHTLGLSNAHYFKEGFARTVRNRQAAIDAGYRYSLLVFAHDGTRIPIPKQWYRMSKANLLSHLQRTVSPG